MMNKQNIVKARRLCDEVAVLCEKIEATEKGRFAEAEGRKQWCTAWPSKTTGELRRRSMDLTRALADLRRP